MWALWGHGVLWAMLLSVHGAMGSCVMMSCCGGHVGVLLWGPCVAMGSRAWGMGHGARGPWGTRLLLWGFGGSGEKGGYGCSTGGRLRSGGGGNSGSPEGLGVSVRCVIVALVIFAGFRWQVVFVLVVPFPPYEQQG